MQPVDISKDQVKLAFLSMVGYLFDEGIIPGEWVRWNGDAYETVEIDHVMGTVQEHLLGGHGHAK
jgi:hypothetical protein